MKGDPKVLSALNTSLTAIITAHLAYCRYKREAEWLGLGECCEEGEEDTGVCEDMCEAAEELCEAMGETIKRILDLNGRPAMQAGTVPEVGTTPQTLFQAVINVETALVDILRTSAATSFQANDFTTFDMLGDFLEEAEERLAEAEATQRGM